MTTALDKIVTYKKDEVSDRKQRLSASELEERVRAARTPLGFAKQLDTIVDAGRNALICELKRKSPSAGNILLGADPLSVSSDYEEGGAACLSVLTDGPSFGGTLDDLDLITSKVTIPVLRKDFMIDPWQVLEARAHNADAILVILSAVDDGLAAELISTTVDLGMDAVIEVHDEAELERALNLNGSLIGVNNRNLKTMQTDLNVSERLARHAGPQHKLISESGVKTREDISRLRRCGFRRFLIGESLMKEPSQSEAVSALVSAD